MRRRKRHKVLHCPPVISFLRVSFDTQLYHWLDALKNPQLEQLANDIPRNKSPHTVAENRELGHLTRLLELLS